MSKPVQYTIFFILLLLIIILVIVNLFLPQIYLLLSPEPERTGELSASPTLIDEKENLYKVDIKFKSGDGVEIAKPVSAVAFSLSYPKDPLVEVTIVDEEGIGADSVQLGPIVSSNQWEVPINRVIETESGVKIEFAAINTTPSGFTTSNFVTLGSVYFKSEKPISDDIFVLSFNTDESVILSKAKPLQDILDTEAKLFYSVE